MKKKPTNKKQQDDKVSLKDHLNQDVFAKLKEKKKELQVTEKKQQEIDEEKRREERRQREKNKTFEELFNESNMDWKKFK